MWRDIARTFQLHGHNVTAAILDRKMRNLKHHYKTILDNNRKSSTGRGRIHWEHFEAFNEIFADDRTVQGAPVMSSMETPHMSKTIPPAFHSNPYLQQPPSTSEPPILSLPPFITPITSTAFFPSTATVHQPLRVQPIGIPDPSQCATPSTPAVSPSATETPSTKQSKGNARPWT